MKKLAYILAAAMVLLCGCKKEDDSSTSEVGKWYGYNTAEDGSYNKNDVAYMLDLKSDKSAEYIISAWGCRWKGTYTYDGEEVKLTWKQYYARPAAIPLSDYLPNPCSPENIYKEWVEVTSNDEGYEDAGQYGDVLVIKFTFKGDKGTIDMFNKPCVAERQK